MQANQTVDRQLSCVPPGESQRPPQAEVCRAPLSPIDAIAGKSAAVQHVLTRRNSWPQPIRRCCCSGKREPARNGSRAYIHQLSARRARAMVCVNCAAIPATLIESELFGRERGAYHRRELAADRTIRAGASLDDLSRRDRRPAVRGPGEAAAGTGGAADRAARSVKSINVDTRIIAATNRSLEQRIAGGGFRADLFYRLNVFPLRVPPLRERAEDVPLLVWRFIEEFSTTFGKRIEEVPAENMAALQRYGWPGNIRELRNAVERAMILANGPRLIVSIPTPLSVARLRSLRLVDVQKEHIRQVLETAGWRVRGLGGAAVRLGLRPTTLETRMAKLGLSRPRAS